MLKQLDFAQLKALPCLIKFKRCAEENFDATLDRSLRLVSSNSFGLDASLLEETYLLAENGKNPNRGTMKISISFMIDPSGGRRRLFEAHAHLSDEEQK
jgi:hypothetical protein